MKKLIGVILILAGICLAGYIGIWLMFIGGILDIASQISIGHVEIMRVAWDLIKMSLASIVATFTFYICSFIGVIFLQ